MPYKELEYRDLSKESVLYGTCLTQNPDDRSFKILFHGDVEKSTCVSKCH